MSLRAGEAHDGVHRQEVRRILQRLDQPQLVPQDAGHLVGQTFGIARRRALPGQPLQRLLRRQAGRHRLARILIGQLVEREAAALGDLQRAREGFGIAAEQPRHLLGRLQVAIGMALAAEAGVVDGAAMADAGDHVLQDAPRRHMEQHVVGDHGRHPRLGREIGQLVQPELVVRPAAQGQRQIAAIAEGLAQPAQLERAGVVGDVGDQHRDQALAIGDEIGPVEPALRLAAALLAEAEQPAEPGIGRAVGRVDQHRDAVHEVEAAADDQPDAGVLRRLMRPHDAGEAVAVDDGQRLDPEGRGFVRTAPRRSWPRAGRRNAR